MFHSGVAPFGTGRKGISATGHEARVARHVRSKNRMVVLNFHTDIGDEPVPVSFPKLRQNGGMNLLAPVRKPLGPVSRRIRTRSWAVPCQKHFVSERVGPPAIRLTNLADNRRRVRYLIHPSSISMTRFP